MRFKDQGALVTGAGSGIGREVAQAFAAEGAHVAAADIDREMAGRTVEEIRKTGGSAHAFALDVTDAKAVAQFVEAAASRLGSIDVLVNSAGIREIRPVLELSMRPSRLTAASTNPATALPSATETAARNPGTRRRDPCRVHSPPCRRSGFHHRLAG